MLLCPLSHRTKEQKPPELSVAHLSIRNQETFNSFTWSGLSKMEPDRCRSIPHIPLAAGRLQDLDHLQVFVETPALTTWKKHTFHTLKHVFFYRNRLTSVSTPHLRPSPAAPLPPAGARRRGTAPGEAAEGRGPVPGRAPNRFGRHPSYGR